MLILMMMLGVGLVIGSEISWQGMELGLDGFGIMTRFLGWIRSISMKIRVKNFLGQDLPDHIHFQMCEMSEVYDS